MVEAQVVANVVSHTILGAELPVPKFIKEVAPSLHIVQIASCGFPQIHTKSLIFPIFKSFYMVAI